MKKWPIFLAGAAIAIVGCGGGGGHNLLGATATGTTTSGIASGDSIATPNFRTSVAVAYIYYLSGQGRAPGDITANMASALLSNSATGASLTDPLPKELDVLLNAYSQQAQILEIPAGGITDSVSYNTFVLNVNTLSVDNGGGNFTTITGPNGTYFINAANGAENATVGTSGSFAAQVTLFPGRQTTLQVFLDDASIAFNPLFPPNQGQYQFFRTIFLSDNTSADDPNLQGFISDYVMFDITKVPNPPHVLAADGVTVISPATRVYLSGEDKHYGVSGSAYGGPFTVYTPFGVATGSFKGPDSLPNPPTGTPQISAGGTYTTRDPDPRDLSGISKITSLQGIWQPVTSVFNNLGAFEVITMPHIDDNNNQDIVVMVRDAGGNITNMYVGNVDLSAGTFAVFPIGNIETGASTNEIDGTVSGFLDASGNATTIPTSARSGRYKFTGTLPVGFKATGRFVVYRI